LVTYKELGRWGADWPLFTKAKNNASEIARSMVRTERTAGSKAKAKSNNRHPNEYNVKNK